MEIEVLLSSPLVDSEGRARAVFNLAARLGPCGMALVFSRQAGDSPVREVVVTLRPDEALMPADALEGIEALQA